MAASPAALELDRVERIVVLRALHLGDLLCAVPALRALRAAAPQARITLAGLPWAAAFARRFRAYVDDFLVFPGFRGFVEAEGDFRALRAFARDARRRRFDLAIQMHGSGERSNRALPLFAAARSAGYRRGGRQADGFPLWRDGEPEVERWVRLVTCLGAPRCGAHLEWPLEAEDLCAAEEILDGLRVSTRRYACMHPGSRLPSRRWPLDRFARVACELVHAGIEVVLTGSAGESDLAAQIVSRVPEPLRAHLHDACGLTSMGSLAALVARAELVVSNDTGLSHVAAAVGTRSVIISSGGDARRWAPADRERHRLLWHDTACRPCTHAECPTDHACARGVSDEAVMDEVRAQLASAALRTSSTRCSK